MSSSSLCPHVFKEYTLKVSEVIEAYKPQILAKVKFTDISQSLLSYHVIKKKEIDKLVELQSNSEQVDALLELIKKRMWGLENFITVLVDRNVDSWLSEELFQTYVRHVVVNLKKMQGQNSCCCFQAVGNSKMHQAWMTLLETADKYMTEIGESLGFLTFTMHPTTSALNFISEMLRVRKKKRMLFEDDDDCASDQESEANEVEDVATELNNPGHGHSHNDFQFPGATACLNERENQEGSLSSSSLLSIYESCSSLTDTELNKVLNNIKDNNEMCLSWDLANLMEQLQSVSLQEENDEIQKSSSSTSSQMPMQDVKFPESEITAENIPDNFETPDTPAVTDASKRPSLKAHTQGTSVNPAKEKSASGPAQRFASKKSSIVPATVTKKLATAHVTPRQRVVQEFRAKRANTPAPSPPPKNDQRLSPQEYNCQNQQWLQVRDRSVKKQPLLSQSHSGGNAPVKQ